MDLVTLAEKWGWLFAIILYFLPKMWQFVEKVFLPSRIREREKAAQAVRDADATILKAKIEREEREFAQRLKLEERTVTAIEQIQAGISNVQQILVTMQAQLNRQDTFMFNATQDVKSEIEKLQDLEGIKKRQLQLEKEMQIITQPGMKKKP